MATPLLNTKLYVPPLSSTLVPRPRLVKQLDEGLRQGCRLTLISAPAGFGKTTLLSEWVQKPGIQREIEKGSSRLPGFAWVSLDEGDSDLVRFWAYAIAALGTIQAGLGESVLAMLRSPQHPSMEAMLTMLINDLDAIPHDFVLVLDDYHVIAAQPIHQTVAFLLDHLPPHMRVVISGRTCPPLALARLRARGQVTELRADDLRFTANEAATFLNHAMGLNLTAKDVDALESRTEGWIAGLQLAALSLQGQDVEHTQSFIMAFAGDDRYILDYLTQEVLHHQPPALHSFLMQTAILDRLCGPLCNAVTGQADSQQQLEELERNNLFIVPLDNRRQWYRYHHLFADLLRHHLRQTQAQQIPELHRRAADWYERNDLIDEAIHHALAAQDFACAIRLIEGVAYPTMLVRGEPYTLLRWLGALPATALESRPWLGLARAWALIATGQLDAADEQLAVVESAGDAWSAGENWDSVGEIAAARATLAMLRGDVDGLVKQAHLANERLPEDDSPMRGVVAWLVAQAYRHVGDAAAAVQAFAQAAQLSQAAGNPFFALLAASNRADQLIDQGKLQQAAEAHRHVQAMAGEKPLPVVGDSFVVSSVIFLEWNDLEAAINTVVHGIELARQASIQDVVLSGYFVLARAKQAQQDPGGALDVIQEALELAQAYDAPHRYAEALAWQARLWLLQGKLDAAVCWAQDSGLSVDDKVSYLQENEYLTLARVLIAQGQAEKRQPPLAQAAQLLARLLQAAQAGGRMCRVIEVLTLQVLTCAAQGDHPQALATLERALSLAEPEGYVRTFLDQGPAMIELLGNVKAQDERMKSYVHRLLFASDEQKDLSASSFTSQPLVKVLSERERQVLRLVAAHRSNQEIADALCVSSNTVKTHLKRIYAKLNVRSRFEAVEQAKKLDWL